MASSRRYAELHLHLEGTLDAKTLKEIVPALGEDEIRKGLEFTDFLGFLQSFKFAVMQLNSADAYRVLARSAFEKLHNDGVVYAEVIHSAGVCLWRGLDAAAIVEALIEEGRRAPLEVRWILDGVRQFGAEHVMQVARLAASVQGREVVGFGVGGDETGCDAWQLRAAFQLAREAGLKLLPHAGETSNAENVWGALALGADRIGHGIRAIEDPVLVRELAARQVPLEISITSNLMTGAVPTLAAHPALPLFRAGVPIVLNTDDPAFFHTTMDREFDVAASLGFTAEELEQVRQNGFRFAASGPPLPESA